MGYLALDSPEIDPKKSEKYLDRILTLFPDSAYGHYLKSKMESKNGHFFSAFYHSYCSHQRDALNLEYRNWYQSIKNNLTNLLENVGH